MGLKLRKSTNVVSPVHCKGSVSSEALPPGCSHLEVADAPQLGTIVSTDTPVATGGVITDPQVALPLWHICKTQQQVCLCVCVCCSNFLSLMLQGGDLNSEAETNSSFFQEPHEGAGERPSLQCSRSSWCQFSGFSLLSLITQIFVFCWWTLIGVGCSHCQRAWLTARLGCHYFFFTFFKKLGRWEFVVWYDFMMHLELGVVISAE